jgi:hypothetical protein
MFALVVGCYDSEDVFRVGAGLIEQFEDGGIGVMRMGKDGKAVGELAHDGLRWFGFERGRKFLAHKFELLTYLTSIIIAPYPTNEHNKMSNTFC